jgi:hypothetical protein
MAADDTLGTVTIYRRGRTGLYADDQGVTVRNPASRTRRVAWAEISCFADGARMSEGSYFWVLHIVLHTGRKVTVMAGPPTPETLAAIRQVAARYGIPAEVVGVPVKKGRPAHRGLYEDPGGQAGLRYWDGRQWSPLLPPDIGKRETVRKSLGSWSALPTAEGRWTGAAAEARRLMVRFAIPAAVSAALLAWALLNELGLYHVARHDHWNVGTWLSVYGFAVLFAVVARRFWRDRRFVLKLGQAANGSADRGR